MHIARRISASTASVSAKPRAETIPCRPCSTIAASSAARSGPSPRNSPRRPSIRRAASAIAATASVTCFSGISRAANSTTGSVGPGVTGSRAPGVEPAQHGHRAAQSLLAQAPACSSEKQNARWGTRAQARWTSSPMRPPTAPRYSRQ